jgi:hypothetical protein
VGADGLGALREEHRGLTIDRAERHKDCRPPSTALEATAGQGSEALTHVIEDGVIPRTLRRPLDLARLVLALLIRTTCTSCGDRAYA